MDNRSMQNAMQSRGHISNMCRSDRLKRVFMPIRFVEGLLFIADK